LLCLLEKLFFNFSPNEAMATGGTGDVLAGILGGLACASLCKIEDVADSVIVPTEIAEQIVLMSVGLHSESGKLAKLRIVDRAP
jgi:NAD(P)H-hydrate repair Nnr-like enzyme with NAD(P)H-hydrate dehydratase domain